MTVQRVTAGQTVTATFTPASTSGAFTADAIDAVGRRMTCTAEVAGSDVTVTIAADQWADGRPGVGRVELKQVNGATTTIAGSRQLRILPGIDAYERVCDRY